jgi:hypothetical protein
MEWRERRREEGEEKERMRERDIRVGTVVFYMYKSVFNTHISIHMHTCTCM